MFQTPRGDLESGGSRLYPRTPTSHRPLTPLTWSSGYHHQESLKLQIPHGLSIKYVALRGQRCVTVCDKGRGPVMRDVTLQKLKTLK